MTVSPIKPEDVPAKKMKDFPDGVMKVWNTLIAEKFVDGKATIMQDTAIERLLEHFLDLHRKDIFDRNWLDIEDIYRQNGWNVQYVKALYYDNFSSYFVFTPKEI